MQTQFKEGLAALSPEEIKLLDEVIDNNPQFYAIVQKAWPFIAEVFLPFVENDNDGDADDVDPNEQGGEPIGEAPDQKPPQQPQQMMGPRSALAGPQFRR